MNGKRNYVTSFVITKFDDCVIIWVENWPCNNKHELLARERHWIENNDCVNKVIPTRTHKEYYEMNKDKITQKMKDYKEANKEKLNTKRNKQVECVCGSLIRHCEKARHERTEKHKAYLALSTEN